MRATSSLFLLLVGAWVGAAMELQCFDKQNGRVAFYASLTGVGGYTGPYDTMTTLVYKKVITNLGEAYNPATGIFVAPVKGIYHFSFYYHSRAHHPADLYLQKNGVTIAIASHQRSNDGVVINGSNAAIVELEKGDKVCVMLRESSEVWDDTSHHTTFNGYLLYDLPSHTQGEP